MALNTGRRFEDEVYAVVERLVSSRQFLLSEPYVKIRRRAKYYSRDREAPIECDIAVEKYLRDPDAESWLHPALIVVIECKDYRGPVPVDDVEEFHAKLQQIGADNTKGILIAHEGAFQKSALRYAQSKGIGLAIILPDSQVHYILECRDPIGFYGPMAAQRVMAERIRALTGADYISEDGDRFFSLTGESSLPELVRSRLR